MKKDKWWSSTFVAPDGKHYRIAHAGDSKGLAEDHAFHCAGAQSEWPSGLSWESTKFIGYDEPADAGVLRVVTCAGCGEPWPCSDSKRTDIRPELRANHHV